MEYGGDECSNEDLLKVEARLRAQGYRLAVNKIDIKDLEPGDYIKNSYGDSSLAWGGK